MAQNIPTNPSEVCSNTGFSCLRVFAPRGDAVAVPLRDGFKAV